MEYDLITVRTNHIPTYVDTCVHKQSEKPQRAKLLSRITSGVGEPSEG